MMDLALHAKLDHVSLADIAGRQHISLAYLEQLFGSLRKAGLIHSVRGAKGGYKLAKDDKDISNYICRIDKEREWGQSENIE